MPPVLRNPILPGFYPDPSVCRVGEDYYLVNSSFEYFPGVPVFHSRDLVNWRQIGHCLTRPSQLRLGGVKPSDGIYAPTIRHHQGTFYMVTTIREAEAGFRNFYVHTKDPAGEWSEPVWVDQGGIDPSLWFDDNGRIYFTSNGTGWAPVRGAYQCEIDIRSGQRLTETRFLWPGTGGCYPEAAHLFRRGDWYYLTLAEGGTADGHMVTISRSATPWGPFDGCPHNPILTHRSRMSPIQATGHADLFEDHRGQWWAVFLGIRYADDHCHHLGRETFLAPVDWTPDGWPVVNGGELVALEMTPTNPLPSAPVPAPAVRDDFDAPQPTLPWVRLRVPDPADASLTARPGWLRLSCAAATLDDLASPAYLARRQQHFDCRMATRMIFEPRDESEEAGLALLIDHRHHVELLITQRAGGTVALLRQRIGELAADIASVAISGAEFTLEISATAARYHFSVAARGIALTLGSVSTRTLSTEFAGGYTGVVVGPYASGRGQPRENAAFFDWFDYEPAPLLLN